jgi:sugar-specific transcriptional regulator TrmB
VVEIRKEDMERPVKGLLGLGFTEYQAKVYAGMLALSEAKASELLDLVDVPKARIYQILDELLEMGVIRKKPGKPLRYTALPPDEGLDNMLEWRRERSEKELSLLKESKENLIEDLRELAGGEVSRVPAKKGFMEIIPAGEISEVETKKAYRAAGKEILILTGVFEYLPRVLSEIERAVQRGIKVRVLFLNPGKLSPTSGKVQEEVIGVIKGIKNVEFRFCDSMPLRGTIVDSHMAIFSVDERKPLPFQKEIGITENENMAKALNIYFESMWDKAKEL